jgi:hypothetical protein
LTRGLVTANLIRVTGPQPRPRYVLVVAVAAALGMMVSACSPHAANSAADPPAGATSQSPPDQSPPNQSPANQSPANQSPAALSAPTAVRSPAAGHQPTHQPTAGAPGTARCPKPAFTTSSRLGGWNTHGYFVYNDMWNDSVPLGPQTLYACAYNNWYVVSNQTNNAGAVKTYPNVHKDFNQPKISSLKNLTSSFAATAPQAGIYNVAFDIWTNGIASSGSTEIMIWTENFHQVPSGSRTTTVTLSGRTYDVFRTSNGHYLAFVPKSVLRSGTLNVLELLKWTIARGYLATSSTLGQICYGVEVVSTGGRSQTFSFTNFSVTSA